MDTNLRPVVDFKFIEGQKMLTAGRYKNSYPRGVVIDFTGGRDQTLEDALDHQKNLANEKMCGAFIAPKGEIIMGFPLTDWGVYAGQSNWEGLGEKVHRHLLGINVVCVGQLKSNVFGVYDGLYSTPQVNDLTETTPTYGQFGFYKKVTSEQWNVVTAWILKLYDESPVVDGEKVFNLDFVLGRHEVSGIAGLGKWLRNGIGGSWLMPMDEYRKYLKQLSRMGK